MGNELLSRKNNYGVTSENARELSRAPWEDGIFSANSQINERLKKTFSLLLEGPKKARERGIDYYKKFQNVLYRYYSFLVKVGISAELHEELLNREQRKNLNTLKNSLKFRSENSQPVVLAPPQEIKIPPERIDVVYIPDTNVSVPFEGESVSNVTGYSSLSLSNLSEVGNRVDSLLKRYDSSLKLRDLFNLNEKQIKDELAKRNVEKNVINATVEYVKATRNLFKKMFGVNSGVVLASYLKNPRLAFIGGLYGNQAGSVRAVAGANAIVKTKDGQFYIAVIASKQLDTLKERFNISIKTGVRFRISKNVKLEIEGDVSHSELEHTGITSIGARAGLQWTHNNWVINPYVGYDITKLPIADIKTLRMGVGVGYSFNIAGTPANVSAMVESVNLEGGPQFYRGMVIFQFNFGGGSE